MIKFAIKHKLPLVILAVVLIIALASTFSGLLIWAVCALLGFIFEAPWINIGFIKSVALGVVVGIVSAFIFPKNK